MYEILLTAKSLPGFAHLIPPDIRQELERGELVGVGGLDMEQLEDAPMAVLLCRERNGWMDIVWLASDPAYRGIDAAGWLLDNRLYDARAARKVWGAVADLPQGDARPILENMFTRRGFTITEVEKPIYILTVAELKGNALLNRPFSSEKIIPLAQADMRLKNSVLRVIRRFDAPVPLAEPVDWNCYDAGLSAVFVQNQMPCGLILVSREAGSLILELLWSAEQTAIPVLLAYAAQTAQGNTMPETEIVIPTVNTVAAQIVKKLFPCARSVKTAQVRLPFYVITPELTEIKTDMEMEDNADVSNEPE